METPSTAPLNFFSYIPSVSGLLLTVIFLNGILLCNAQSVSSTDIFLVSLGLDPSAISFATKVAGGEQLACAMLYLSYPRGTVFEAGNSTIYTNERQAHWYVRIVLKHVSFP